MTTAHETDGGTVPLQHRALSSGALMALHPIALHQRGCCASKCGGTFVCAGCRRTVGWCVGSGAELGEEHCDDCYTDRYAVLERVSEGRVNTLSLLRLYDSEDSIRTMPVVAEELRADGFIERLRNGRYRLTEAGKRML